MKEQRKILYIIIAIVIIIGAIVCKIKGFNIELSYSNRQQIILTNNTGLDETKVKEIAKSVLDNRKVKVQKIERFGNGVEIISSAISEEEKANIITKVNEEYSSSISNDDIKITDVANTRIRDILTPYILPGIATLAAVLLYFIIIYNKIGLKKVLLEGIGAPVITLLTYYSLIAITRIPFGRVVNSIAIGLYIISIAIVTVCFQKQREEISKKDKKEND